MLVSVSYHLTRRFMVAIDMTLDQEEQSDVISRSWRHLVEDKDIISYAMPESAVQHDIHPSSSIIAREWDGVVQQYSTSRMHLMFLLPTSI